MQAQDKASTSTGDMFEPNAGGTADIAQQSSTDSAKKFDQFDLDEFALWLYEMFEETENQ